MTAGSFSDSAVGIVLFGAASGGVGSRLSGGNFWEGVVIGGMVAGLNHAMHEIDNESMSISDNNDGEGPNPNRNPKQDKKLTPGEIEKNERCGLGSQ